MEPIEESGTRLSQQLNLLGFRQKFLDHLSDQELQALLSEVSSKCSKGMPILPPRAFRDWAVDLIRQNEFVELHNLVRLLQRDLLDPQPLTNQELEQLSVGLLWQTGLIAECEDRFQISKLQEQGQEARYAGQQKTAGSSD